MALDAATLALCATELKQALEDTRIDRIHQPTRDEVILLLRGRSGSFRLLLSARTGSARICLTQESYENPATPPSFCMLLRKHLGGGRLLDVRPVPAERIVFFDFLCVNEMGDLVHNTLAAELMGRYCNLVLIRRQSPTTGQGAEGDGKKEAAPPVGLPAAAGAGGEQAAEKAFEGGQVIDALKRVDFEDSALRPMLPGLAYTLPPLPPAPDFLRAPLVLLMEKITGFEGPVSEAVRRAAGGVGPVLAREACFRALGPEDPDAAALTQPQRQKLAAAIQAIRADFEKGGLPCLVRKPDTMPVEFSFTKLTQYTPQFQLEEYPGFSVMLEAYYAEKDRQLRLRQRTKALHRQVGNLLERARRKQAAWTQDLADSEKSEILRQKGELLIANLHAFAKGAASITLPNWYTGEEQTIALDVRLAPAANAQKYFKDYKKKQTAAQKLAELLSRGRREIIYLESVLYEVESAANDAEVGQIRAELKEAGYFRGGRSKEKLPKAMDYLRYISGDGFEILVGRNNAQNDRLTLKTARGKDLWFHVKNAPGSHVVVMSQGQDIPLGSQNEAAMLAVWHSSQRAGVQVPVDFTPVKNIRKTAGLPPGLVLYDRYETAYVTPDAAALAALEERREPAEKD